MTTLCCVAKFIRTLSTVISTIDLKLPLYTAGVHRVSDISIIHLFVVICHYVTTSTCLNPQVHSAHPPRLVPASGFRVTWHPLLLCLVSQISVASIVHLSEGYAQIIGPFNPVPLIQIPTTSIHIPLLIEYNKRHSRFQVPNAKSRDGFRKGSARGGSWGRSPFCRGRGGCPSNIYLFSIA